MAEASRDHLEVALVLASGSPRRRQLIDRFAISYLCHVPGSDESAVHAEGVDPATVAARLAAAKHDDTVRSLRDQFGGEVPTSHHADGPTVAPNAVVVAADTIVVHDGAVLGKPTSRSDLHHTVASYSGKDIEVITGVAVGRLDHDAPVIEIEKTRVRFGSLSEAEIAGYVASGEGDDKAGGLSLQGSAGRFIDAVEGCWTNVIGLPLCRTAHLLRAEGLDAMPCCFDRTGQRCIHERDAGHRAGVYERDAEHRAG